LDEFRRQTGMHGPQYVASVLQPETAEDRRFSPRAERIAGLLDTLPWGEQDLIESLCHYLRARRGIAGREGTPL